MHYNAAAEVTPSGVPPMPNSTSTAASGHEVVGRHSPRLAELACSYSVFEVLAANLMTCEGLDTVCACIVDAARPIYLKVNDVGIGSHG